MSPNARNDLHTHITFQFRSEYATDIAEVFPTKHATLLHSRSQLLPRFDEAMHDESESAFFLPV